MTDKVQKIREEVARIQLYTQSGVLKDILDYIDKVKEEPVSTKDKLLALSDGRLHLGWIDDAKVVEFEECLMQFHEDMNNIPQGTDSLTRLKYTDEVLHSYSKKLMSMAKEEPVSEDLEEASKEWLKPQLDKSYANYGEAKMMELTHFDGYAMLDAIEFGANWQKKKYDIIGNDLEEAAENYAQEAYSHPVDREVGKADFILGAKWQFERVNEALLSEVLPCFMHGGEADEVVAKLDEVLKQK